MRYRKDDDEIDSENEQEQLRKKKKRFPFHAKVGGRLARRRPDRKNYQDGGEVERAKGMQLLKDTMGSKTGDAIAASQRYRAKRMSDQMRSADDDDDTTARGRARGGGVGEEKPDTGMPMQGGVDIRKEEPSRRKSGGRITMGQRKALPSSDFALPGKGTGPSGKGPGSYPIDTENRARNALARGAQHASPGKLATIKRKVKAKYPDIEVGGD